MALTASDRDFQPISKKSTDSFGSFTLKIYSQITDTPDESLYLVVLRVTTPILELRMDIAPPEDVIEKVEIDNAAVFFTTSSPLYGADVVYQTISKQEEEEYGIKQSILPSGVQWITKGISRQSAFAILLRPRFDVSKKSITIRTLASLDTASGSYTSKIQHPHPHRKFKGTIQDLLLGFQSPISVAIWTAAHGWSDVLQQLLSKSIAGADDVDSSGRTALSWAAGNGQVETAKILLGSANINKYDNEKRTPLLWAARRGQLDMVALLLDEGAAWTKDYNHYSALGWAARSGQSTVVEYLLARPHIQADVKGELVRPSYPPVLENPSRTLEGCPISIASEKSHVETLLVLVKKAFELLDESNIMGLSSKFLEYWLNKAAAEGWVNLLTILMESDRVYNPEVEYSIPLCIAARQGWTRIVEILLRAGADRDSTHEGNTALCISIKEGHEAVVKALLDLGADTRKPNIDGSTPFKLVGELADKLADELADKAHTILGMLTKANEEGRLAEKLKEVEEKIACSFIATVVLFEDTVAGLNRLVVQKSVKELLSDPTFPKAVTEREQFRWLHLPANNMLWVEVLMLKLYEQPAKAYQILTPERWVRRQHRGATGKPHARFMRPHCQYFGNEATTSLYDGTKGPRKLVSSPNLVLFIPFLHWDANSMRLERQRALETKESALGTSKELAETELVGTYSNDTPHSLHIRRTLDQYYYHTLQSTESRDDSQVATRYQESKGLPSSIISMVDQLWLWVIRGTEGKPDIVISCFPRVAELEKSTHPDPYRRTDVLENIKRHLIDDPGSVHNADDLAGLIAAKCSRTYLDPASTLDLSKDHKGVQFSDMYEDAIGNIMHKEATAFKNFQDLSKAPEGRIILADIKDEISWLAEIKDVLDELNIKAFIFEAQKKEFRYLDSIIRSSDMKYNQRSGFINEVSGNTLQFVDTRNHGTLNLLGNGEGDSIDFVDFKNHGALNLIRGEVGNRVHFLNFRNHDEVNISKGSEDVSDSEERDPRKISLSTGENRHKRVIRENNQDARPRTIWAQHGDGLLLNHVNLSIEEIRGMRERATRAYNSVNFLIDLKLKHNNVIDSNKALELSSKTASLTKSINESTAQTKNSVETTEALAKKADKEGSTIMVFTVVTIIFLPLSFMTTMFQLDIRQYKRVDDKLDLGYVSAIIFPISTVISALLIWVAFKAAFVERKLSQVFKRRKNSSEIIATGDEEAQK
ncbi:hypothetical protein N0V90_009777 [Kalmusia sp. IMI 367209]|nr:hypothetical protein N0V90_009777 [Kalmusia sp. IMI 367209]